ncbi:MAG: hypothetical protein K8L91_31315 [Anaerolineae bacterium]|nr:hypothetical protein [Anaerolineae bacterium]
MATRTIQLETTTPEELIELMRQHGELVVMQNGIPLAKVSPMDTGSSEPFQRSPNLHLGGWMSDDFNSPLL